MRRGATGIGFGWAFGALALAAYLGAQDAEPPAPAAGLSKRPVVKEARVEVGGRYQVWCRGPWSSTRRIADRPAPLWQLYMHGVVDFFATPVPWETLFGDDQPSERWLDRKAFLRTEVRASNMPALKLGSGDSILLEKRLPVAHSAPGDGAVRVFVWLRAENANGHEEAELLPTRTPSLEILVHDAIGRTVGLHRGPMRTRGTFGWHCYYVDVPVSASPRSDAMGGERLPGGGQRTLHVRLKNPTGGTVWFSTLSWELVTDVNTYRPEDMQDPATGSLAPFPAMDELPVHLISGQAYAHPWRFFKGAEGGARMVPDLTSPEAISKYVRSAAKSDPTGCLGGVVFLGSWLHTAGEHAGLLTLPPEWHREFRNALVALQEQETGFWGTSENPRSMAATARMVENLWGSADGKRPWLGYGGALPKARTIVRTVLGSRTPTMVDGADVGAWGELTFNWRAPGEPEEEPCSLAATRNAVVLLDLAGAGLTGKDRAEVEQAMASAWRGVFRSCVQADGLWRLASHDSIPSRPAFLPRILELSGWLAERTDAALPPPVISAAAGGPRREDLTFAWQEPPAGAAAVRIFAAPAGTALGDIHMGHMVALIERDGSSILSMSPVHVAGRIRDAARAKWGVDIASGGDVPLLASRLAIYDRLKGMASGAEPVVIQVSAPAKLSFFAASANGEGWQSPLVEVPVEGLAAEAPAGEAGAGEGEGVGEEPQPAGDAVGGDAEPAGDAAVPPGEPAGMPE